MKIGILGTRGIPNAYGGFEQFAEYLSKALVKKGHEVWVYCSSSHPYRMTTWEGVHLIHIADPEGRFGTTGQFIYDYSCFSDARKRDFTILLQLGYTSSSIWYFRWPRTINVVNMDGLEWKRSKYSRPVQAFLKKAEALAVRHADHLVSDSLAIRNYIKSTYNSDSSFIAYGADIPTDYNEQLLQNFGIAAGKYFLVIARMEPENNIETIIRGYLRSKKEAPLVLVGNMSTGHASELRKQYLSPSIRFIPAIYDREVLNALRHYSAGYFHGHSVGGTNPSLLEAMACSCPIIAHDNEFNRSVLGPDALYFKDEAGVAAQLDLLPGFNGKQSIDNNLQKIRQQYQWPQVIDAYDNLFTQLAQQRASGSSL